MSRPFVLDADLIAWKKLRKQKAKLVDQASRVPMGGSLKDALDGIIHLLDYIQDQAAEVIGEEKVFGKD